MDKRSYTLVEVLITIVVSALVINSVVMSIVNSMVLNDYNQGFGIAMNIARAKTEEVISKKSNLSSIVNEDGPLTLAQDGINGRYRIDVTDVVANELKNVKIAVCWTARGRIVGDCAPAAVPGTLQWSGTNSPCTIETAVAQR